MLWQEADGPLVGGWLRIDPDGIALGVGDEASKEEISYDELEAVRFEDDGNAFVLERRGAPAIRVSGRIAGVAGLDLIGAQSRAAPAVHALLPG